MFSFLANFFHEKGIDLAAPLLLKDCTVQKPYLLERAGIEDGTAYLLAVPYFTKACADPSRNLSAYAVSRDYHGFFEELFGELLPILRERYPGERFAGFADHSPIAEAEAAARAGLGIMGENGLLITEKYASYIFLGELITTAKPTEAPIPLPVQTCERCGLCKKSCPMRDGIDCLSAVTQKGDLSPKEEEAILRYKTAWGCDACQEVCPHTKRAMQSGSILSPIPYFSHQAIPRLTSSVLSDMPDEALSHRAYAWRGRKTIERNLRILEQNPEKC